MFKRKKIKKQIEALELEKKELLFIKQQLEDSTPKINISDIYVWKASGVYSLVKLDIKKIVGRTWGGIGRLTEGYESTLIDIFSNNVVYQKSSIKKISRNEFVKDGEYYALLLPLHEVDNNLLAYANKEVPMYVLQQLFYKLNNVDVNAYKLKKQK